MNHIPERQDAYGSSNTKLLFMNNVKFVWYKIIIISELLNSLFSVLNHINVTVLYIILRLFLTLLLGIVQCTAHLQFLLASLLPLRVCACSGFLQLL